MHDDDVFIDDSDDQDDEELELEAADESAQETAQESEAPQNEETPRRKRGRPKGIKAGPRPVVWVCAGMVGGKVIQERIMAQASASSEEKQNFSEEDARDAFKSKHGVEPLTPEGPFYDRKGGAVAQSTRKKEVIPVAITEYDIGDKKCTGAVFHGWRGLVHKIKVQDPEAFKVKYGVPAEECCIFFAAEEVAPEGKKKVKPAPNVVLLTAVNVPDVTDNVATIS